MKIEVQGDDTLRTVTPSNIQSTGNFTSTPNYGPPPNTGSQNFNQVSNPHHGPYRGKKNNITNNKMNSPYRKSYNREQGYNYQCNRGYSTYNQYSPPPILHPSSSMMRTIFLEPGHSPIYTQKRIQRGQECVDPKKRRT